MALQFGSFFSPSHSVTYTGSLSLAIAIQGCIGRELYCSSMVKALTTADYASCCHLYIQQYVISFLSLSHLSFSALPSFFSSPANSVCIFFLSLSSLAKLSLVRLSTLIFLFIHLSRLSRSVFFFPFRYSCLFLCNTLTLSVGQLSLTRVPFFFFSFSHALSPSPIMPSLLRQQTTCLHSVSLHTPWVLKRSQDPEDECTSLQINEVIFSLYYWQNPQITYTQQHTQ